MKRSTIVLLVVIAVLVIFGGTWLFRSPAPTGLSTIDSGPGPVPTVAVAANVPMTGVLSYYGNAIREGATMAVDELAKKPGHLQLAVDWQDNGSDAKNAVTIMQQQYLRPIDIYVSGVKPQAMAIKDAISAKGTPHFIFTFDVYVNHNSSNNLRTWPNYKLEAPVYLEYARARGAHRVAIVYVQLPHTSEEFNTLVIPGLEKLGITDVYAEPFELGKKDFKDVATKVRAFKPDLIILNGFQADLVGMIRAARPLGLIHDGNTICTYDLLDAAKVLGPDELEGLRLVAPVFDTRPERELIRLWRERFQARYDKAPDYTHAYAYDMVTILNDAGSRLTLPATAEQWITALRATQTEGVTGPLSFDEDGSLVTPVELGLYHDGKLAPTQP
jgi:ABC-type branched-subunit amino acid transport system substrate-binding protein